MDEGHFFAYLVTLAITLGENIWAMIERTAKSRPLLGSEGTLRVAQRYPRPIAGSAESGGRSTTACGAPSQSSDLNGQGRPAFKGKKD